MAEADFDTRRRRLRFRAWHRGIREADLILGRFADAHAPSFSEAEIAAFEKVLDIQDQDLVAIVSGATAASEEDASPMLARIVSYYEGIR